MARIPFQGYRRYHPEDGPFTDLVTLPFNEWVDHGAGLPTHSSRHFFLTGREPETDRLYSIAPGLDGVNINDFDLDDFKITQDYDSAIMICKAAFEPNHRIYFVVCPEKARELSKDVAIFTEIPEVEERVSVRVYERFV